MLTCISLLVQKQPIFKSGLKRIDTHILGTPGRPTVIGNSENAAVLSWTAPESDGGSPIVQYEIEYKV